MAQLSETVVFYRRSTRRFHVYDDSDGGTHYVHRSTLTFPPPDVLIGSFRTPDPADLERLKAATPDD
jgi:hypothetical protein